MDLLDGVDGWSLPETLNLLLLKKAGFDWPEISLKLKDRFGRNKEANFYDEQSCKERLHRLISSPHPEHFLRHEGKKYSQKGLVQEWISFLERKLVEERAIKKQLLLVQFREKLALFNKLFDDRCNLSNERVQELLREARIEDSKHDPKTIERGIARILPKIQELSNLHNSKPDVYGCLRLVVPVPQLCEVVEEENNVVEEVDQAVSPVSPGLIFEPVSETLPQSSSFQTPQPTESQASRVTPTQSPLKSAAVILSKDLKSVPSSPQKLSGAKELSKSPVKTPVRSPVYDSGTIHAESAVRDITLTGNNDEVAGEGIRVEASSEVGELIARVKIEPEVMEVDISNPQVGSLPEENRIDIPNSLDMQSSSFPIDSVECTPVGEVSTAVAVPIKDEIIEEVSAVEQYTRERSPEKRQLRSMRKDFEAADLTPVGLRGERSQRSATRKVSSTVGDMDLETTDVITSTAELIRPQLSSPSKSSAVGKSPSEISKLDYTETVSLRSFDNEEKRMEDTEESLSRRRSDRLRGSEISSEQLEVKPTVVKRKNIGALDTSDEELSMGNARKRRRLALDSSAESTEASSGLSPVNAVEQSGESDKKILDSISASLYKREKKLSVGEDKGAVVSTSRRSSLRSAGHATHEEGHKEVHTDTDEEATLGDIREKHRSPRKQVGDGKVVRIKEDEMLKKQTVISDEDVSKNASDLSLEAVLESPRRGRASRIVSATPKLELQSPKKSKTERKHPKKKDIDDGSTEKKIFLMSAWRHVSSHRHAAIFGHPVSERDAQGYSATVKKRMDLSTLKKNVESGEVRDLAEFKRRLLLMFANAVMFNSTGHDVNIYAKEMARDTLGSLKDFEKEIFYVRGGTHVTRRSAAFAAEEERKKVSSAVTTVSRPPVGKVALEDVSPIANVQKASSSRRSFGRFK